MPGKINFEFSFGKPRAGRQAAPAERAPARILLIGDFSGSGSGASPTRPISKRQLHALDIDGFDAFLARMKPRITLEALGDDGADLGISIEGIDDLHPDALYRKLDAFRFVREMRARLLDPGTFAAAAEELNPSKAAALSDERGGGLAKKDQSAEAPPDPSSRPEDDASTLERLLGKRASGTASSPSRQDQHHGKQVDLRAFIKDLVAPHVVPDADPRQDVYVGYLDSAIQAKMRAILHHPSFQRLESTWRALSWLVTELELGEDLQLYVCDLGKEELLADVRAASDQLEESEFYRLVVEQERGTPGGRTWSLILGDYYFGHSEEDIFLLAALGAIAAQAGAPFLGGAKDELLGCRSLAEAPDPSGWSNDDLATRERWMELRHSSQATSLGLALPRVLLRLPYGNRTDRIETFAFEEMPGHPEHDSFLWGNPAYACTLIWGRLLTQQADERVLEGLPTYVYDHDNAQLMKPCAELLLSERAGQGILDRGLIPLLSHRNANKVTCPRIQSLSDPSTLLPGD